MTDTHAAPAPTTAELLDFETQHPDRMAARKEAAIRARFGFGPARYWQLLAAACRTPEAARHDALTARLTLDRITARALARQEGTPQ